MAIPFYDRWGWGQFLRKPPIKEGKLLDVCCFYGEFLSIAVGMYDYKVKGIDINRAAVEQGRKKYGLELLSITIEDFAKAYPKEKFDVVTFFEVLEHLDKPNEFIEMVKRILVPNGLIAISVPNRNESHAMRSKSYQVSTPEHLTGWSAKALRNFLTSHGFEILVLKEKPIGILSASEICGILNSKFSLPNLKNAIESCFFTT